ncbi:unnamed protein product [Rhizophagus irregularis]|nr:unnamed protein product [Rhizophagus irregularis]
MLLLKDYRHYDHQDFKILSEIGTGGSAAVYAAYWKNTTSKFAIKKITQLSVEKEIINEIDIIKKVDFHPNIIKFVGIIKNEINYSLVLEYADGGTLGKYLENARTLKPEIQLKFAKEIASAIYCLHNYDIIHRDIHPNNILIHGHTIKLADFGRSCLKESDVDTEVFDILNGVREEPIPNTNVKFIKLYQQCWRHEQDERPDANQIVSELNEIDSENNFNFEENENEKIKIVAELKSEEIKDDFSDCHLSNY